MTRGLFQYGRNRFFRLVSGIPRASWLTTGNLAASPPLPRYIYFEEYVLIPASSRNTTPPAFLNNPLQTAGGAASQGLFFASQSLNGMNLRIAARSAVSVTPDGSITSAATTGPRHVFEFAQGRDFGASVYFVEHSSSVEFPRANLTSVGDGQGVVDINNELLRKTALYIRKDEQGYGGNFLVIVSRAIQDTTGPEVPAFRTPRGLVLLEVYKATNTGMTRIAGRVTYSQTFIIPLQVCLTRQPSGPRCVITMSTPAGDFGQHRSGQVSSYVHQESIDFPYEPDTLDSRLIGYTASFDYRALCFSGNLNPESEEDDMYVARQEIDHDSTVKTVYCAGVAGFPADGLQDWEQSQPLSRLVSPQFRGLMNEPIESGTLPEEDQTTSSPLYDRATGPGLSLVRPRGPQPVRAVCLAANESWLSSLSGNLKALVLPRELTVRGRHIGGARFRFTVSGNQPTYETVEPLLWFAFQNPLPMPTGDLSREQILKIGVDSALSSQGLDEYFFRLAAVSEAPLSGVYDVGEFEIAEAQSAAGIFRSKFNEGPFEFNYAATQSFSGGRTDYSLVVVVEVLTEIWCFLGLALQEAGEFVYRPSQFSVSSLLTSPDLPEGKVSGVVFETGQDAASPSLMANVQIRRSVSLRWQRSRTTVFPATSITETAGPFVYESSASPDYVASLIFNKQQTELLCEGQEVVPTTWFLGQTEPVRSPGEGPIPSLNTFAVTMNVSLI